MGPLFHLLFIPELLIVVDCEVVINMGWGFGCSHRRARGYVSPSWVCVHDGKEKAVTMMPSEKACSVPAGVLG